MKLSHLLACGLLTLTTAAFAGGAAGGRSGPRPMPPVGWTYVWVAPAYRTVTTQTWIPGTTQLVEDWMETSPGRFEKIWRQVTTPGHYETTTRQVVVSDGHWELVRVDPPPVYINPPIYVNPPVVVVRSGGTVGVDGYASGPVEDLSKFTPLSDWPK